MGYSGRPLPVVKPTIINGYGLSFHKWGDLLTYNWSRAISRISVLKTERTAVALGFHLHLEMYLTYPENPR